jgi:hypothetical protein
MQVAYIRKVDMSENSTLHTPYSASKVVNKWLENDGVDKQLPPQMFYNYTVARVRKGKKPFIAINEENKIELQDLAEGYTKYV